MAKLSKQLPSDPSTLKAVKGNIQEVVDQLLIIQAAKEQIAAIKETAGEKYGIDVAYLGQIVYDIQYQESKQSNAVLEKAEIIETLQGE